MVNAEEDPKKIKERERNKKILAETKARREKEKQEKEGIKREKEQLKKEE